jgi:hypothetical protein
MLVTVDKTTPLSSHPAITSRWETTTRRLHLHLLSLGRRTRSKPDMLDARCQYTKYIYNIK